MKHQENDENPIWFYNYYGSGFLTIVKHEIYETKGQLISEWLLDFLNFFKRATKKFDEIFKKATKKFDNLRSS